MISEDVVALFLEKVPDEIRSLRDTIARAETDHTGNMWERHREFHSRITELKNRCEEAAHPMIIALEGKAGTRRRLMRNGLNERRTCIMCGAEEIGILATGFLSRFLFRRAKWTFERLNGYISRIFTDPEWYFETVFLIRHFSLPTDVVLQHAFPSRLTSSFLAG